LLDQVIADVDVLGRHRLVRFPKLDRVGMLAPVGGEVHERVVCDLNVRRTGVVDAVAGQLGEHVITEYDTIVALVIDAVFEVLEG